MNFPIDPDDSKDDSLAVKSGHGPVESVVDAYNDVVITSIQVGSNQEVETQLEESNQEIPTKDDVNQLIIELDKVDKALSMVKSETA